MQDFSKAGGLAVNFHWSRGPSLYDQAHSRGPAICSHRCIRDDECRCYQAFGWGIRFRLVPVLHVEHILCSRLFSRSFYYLSGSYGYGIPKAEICDTADTFAIGAHRRSKDRDTRRDCFRGVTGT